MLQLEDIFIQNFNEGVHGFTTVLMDYYVEEWLRAGATESPFSVPFTEEVSPVTEDSFNLLIDY